jgi:hypothetical protein
VLTVAELQQTTPFIVYSAKLLTAASVVLDELEGALETHLGRPLETATFVDTAAAGSYDPTYDSFRVGQTPVVEILEVKVGTTVIADTAYALSPWGLWWRPYGDVTVTYRAGLLEAKPRARESVRRVLRTAATRHLERIVADQQSLESSSVEGTTVKWVLGEPFTDAELKGVERWRRRSGTVAAPTCTRRLTW